MSGHWVLTGVVTSDVSGDENKGEKNENRVVRNLQHELLLLSVLMSNEEISPSKPHLLLPPLPHRTHPPPTV